MKSGQESWLSPCHETTWTKSSASGNGNCCLEVAAKAAEVAIRDSKYARNAVNDPAMEPVIVIDAEQWEAFLLPIRTTGFASAPASATGLVTTPTDDGGMTLTAVNDGTELVYTEGEWTAFVAGVRQGELTTAALAALV